MTAPAWAEHAARSFEPPRRRWPTPGAMAQALDPTTKQTAALRAIDQVCVQLADRDITRGMVFMPPQEGKPVIGSAVILMGDGSRKPLAEVKVGDMVITDRGRARNVTAVHVQGELPTVKITTHAGRVIQAERSHPLLTPEGWVNAGDVVVGDVLANVPSPQTIYEQTLTAEAARLLGYFIGDGNTTISGPSRNINASITCVDADEANDIEKCAAALGFTVNRRPQRLLLSGGVRPWLRIHGLAGCTSRTKRVPAEVFTQPPEIIAQFTGAYFACDGTVSRRGGARPDARVEFNSVSRGLLADVQHLLLRLGIATTVRLKGGSFLGQPYPSWRLLMRRQDDVARFRATVPVVHSKAALLGEWSLRRTAFDAPYLPDPVEAVEDGGLAPCRCLTVADDHTFTVEDIVVHNSQRISRRTPAWLLAADPTLRIAIVSYAADKAERWGRQIRRDILNHPQLGITLRHDSRAAGRWETVQGGGLICVGISGGISGEPVDCLVIDDPLRGRAEAESDVYRDMCWDWWESNGSTRLSDRGVVCLMMTRWHNDDLAGRLMAREPGRWHVLKIPAIAEEGDPLGRQPGEELRSATHSPGWFYDKRATRSGYVWRSIYQQDPVAAQGNLFKRGGWRYWAPGQRGYLTLDGKVFLWADCLRFITVDLAASTKTSADFTVAAAWAVTASGDLVLCDRARGRVEEAEHFDLVRPLRERWLGPYDPVRVEASQYGTTLVYQAGRTGIPIQPLQADVDKLTRAIPASNMQNAGRIWLPADADWLDEWIDELAEFPNGAHDDQVDVCAYAARIVATEWVGVGGSAELNRALDALTPETPTAQQLDMMTAEW